MTDTSDTMSDTNIHPSYPEPQHPDGSNASGFTLQNMDDYSKGNIRMKGLVDEVGAFQRTFARARKMSGQD